MRKLIEGDQPLTRLAVLKEIGKSIDLNCKESVENYTEFENWCLHRGFGWNDIIVNPWDSGTYFWQNYLKDRPAVQQWLVDQGFAKWEDDEIRYSLDGRPGTVKVALREEGNGNVVVYAPDYINRSPNIVDLTNGGYLERRFSPNPKIAKRESDGSRIIVN
jgi:hypothetical protein